VIKYIIYVGLTLLSSNSYSQWVVQETEDPITDAKTVIASSQSIVTLAPCNEFSFDFNEFMKETDYSAVILVRVDKNKPVLLSGIWSKYTAVIEGDHLINVGIYDQMLAGNKIHFRSINSNGDEKTISDDLIGFSDAMNKIACSRKNIIYNMEQVKRKQLNASEKRNKIRAAALKLENLAREKAIKAEKINTEIEAKRREVENLRQIELDKKRVVESADSFSNVQNYNYIQQREIARYKALIQYKITSNWHVESDMKGKACKLTIRLGSAGLVRDVKRVLGDINTCASAQRAVLRAKSLPIPDDDDPQLAQLFREFDLFLEPNF
jgi:hypothetical protein